MTDLTRRVAALERALGEVLREERDDRRLRNRKGLAHLVERGTLRPPGGEDGD